MAKFEYGIDFANSPWILVHNLIYFCRHFQLLVEGADCISSIWVVWRRTRELEVYHFLESVTCYWLFSTAKSTYLIGEPSQINLLDIIFFSKTSSIPIEKEYISLMKFKSNKLLTMNFFFREHKLTQQLKECMGSLTCHAAMIAHVSADASNYSDTLTTVQLASRIHRMRRKRFKVGFNAWCHIRGLYCHSFSKVVPYC